MKTILIFILSFSCTQLPQTRSDITQHTEKPISKQIKPVKTDGCTLWPEGVKKDRTQWIRCCVLHDIAYWKGGIKQKKIKADEDLKKCVEDSGYTIIGDIMKFGVSIGGKPIFKTSFRWGYGWNYNRGYIPLSNEEKEYIQNIHPKPGTDLRKYLDLDKLNTNNKKVKPILY